MRIAQIAPIAERVPPKKYGGTERVVSALTEELVKRGHEVTLFASGDSVTAATLVSVYPRALREAKLRDIYGVNTYTMLHIGVAYERQHEFDIIHDHNGVLSIATANIARTPVVMTMHGPFTTENRVLFQTLRTPYQVTISDAQAYAVPNLHTAGTVYNGLPLDAYPFSATHDDYLLFVGRISLEKGVHYAVETAKALDMRLVIAAKLEPVDEPYFAQYVQPFLDDRVVWIGEVDEVERNRLMSRARGFLHPVTWREPFGLTMIEAMATGCPVIAFNKGSISEVVKNGETGFVVEDIEGMIEAVQQLDAINRAACRAHALKNFSASAMADGYLAVYDKVLRGEV